MSMTPSQLELYERIKEFDFDGEVVPFTFTQRLASDHRWSERFASRVVDEYRRFVFLLVEAGHPCTPSEAVDQAWHQHLSYSRSYWQRLCRETIGRPLHHDPTRGGYVEGQKFTDWYEQTLASYRRLFDAEPPADIWPASDVRFATTMHWIDRQSNMVLPWRQIFATAIFLVGIAVAVVVGFALNQRGYSPAAIVIAGGCIAVIGYAIALTTYRFMQRRDARRGTGSAEVSWWCDVSHWGGCSGCGGSGCGGAGSGGTGGGCGGGGCGGGGCGGG